MIIQRYIHIELLQKLAWVSGLLVLVLASNKFVGFLTDAAEGRLPSDLMFIMLGFKLVSSLPKILPAAILIAMLLTFSRMVSDREFVILAAVGVSRLFQIRIVIRFALVFCAFVTVITLSLAPWAEQNMHKLKQRAKQESDISGIKPGQFKEFSKGDRVVYVQKADAENTSMDQVFVQLRQKGKLSILTADNARFRINEKSGSKYIVFSNGRRYVSTPSLLDYQITEYEKYALLTETTKPDAPFGKTAGISTAELFKSTDKAHQAELQWRISLIISCLLLSLLAFLLFQSHTSERRYLPFIIGISIYLIYSNLLGIAQTLMKREVVPTFIGLWWVHILLIAILALLYYLPALRQRKMPMIQINSSLTTRT